jgi:hypothetical protein
MMNGVFWNVMPCGFCKNRRFGERRTFIIRLTRIGELGTTLAVTNNRSTLRTATRRNIPEDCILQSSRCSLCQLQNVLLALLQTRNCISAGQILCFSCIPDIQFTTSLFYKYTFLSICNGPNYNLSLYFISLFPLLAFIPYLPYRDAHARVQTKHNAVYTIHSVLRVGYLKQIGHRIRANGFSLAHSSHWDDLSYFLYSVGVSSLRNQACVCFCLFEYFFLKISTHFSRHWRSPFGMNFAAVSLLGKPAQEHVLFG